MCVTLQVQLELSAIADFQVLMKESLSQTHIRMARQGVFSFCFFGKCSFTFFVSLVNISYPEIIQISSLIHFKFILNLKKSKIIEIAQIK